MSDKFTRFLKGVGQGITNPKGNLGDARHAARLYVDNQYVRAPRTKFLYHVQFNINRPALLSGAFTKHTKAIDMLVKQADLPKITMEHEIKNQYNKKKIIYKDIKYEPLNLVFHDDNLGVINAMWAQYLSWYSNERLLPQTFWTRDNNPYRRSIDAQVELPDTSRKETTTRYGLDVAKLNYTNPFFDSITIYTLSRKKFNSYVLINPHITSWNHGNLDQASNNGTVEATMNIVYETVLYGTGSVVKGTQGGPDALPRQFTDLYYDNTPSPLSIQGGQISTIFGPGGLLQAGSGIVEDAATIYGQFNVQGNTNELSGFEQAIRAVNLYKSLASLRPENLIAEATNIILTPQGINNVVSGIPGVSFGSGTGTAPSSRSN